MYKNKITSPLQSHNKYQKNTLLFLTLNIKILIDEAK